MKLNLSVVLRLSSAIAMVLAGAAARADGCDNGIPVGGTACAYQGDSVQYVCQPGSRPGASHWLPQSCNGGVCQGAACTSPQQGCDNGLPVGGTACAYQGDSVQYVCQPGSRPGASSWLAQSCNGGTCQNAACAAAPLRLNVPFLSQYQGQSSQNVDCGPTSVAMIVQFRGLRPAGLSNAAFVTQVRSRTGVGNNTSDTGFWHLESSLGSYGLSWSEISQYLSPAPDTQVQTMRAAISAGRPVIALVHGADLGRGAAYGDHWVVVTGFSADGQSVYLNDPDTQGARWSGWIVGGQITLPISTFRNALQHAQSAPYGILVY